MHCSPALRNNYIEVLPYSMPILYKLKKTLLEHPRKLLFPVKNLNFGIMETFHQLTTGVAPFQGKRNQAACGPHSPMER